MSEAEKVNSTPFAEWFNFANSEFASAGTSSANGNETSLPEDLLADEDTAVPCDVSVESTENYAVGSWSSVTSWMETAENGGASLTSEEVATLFGFIQEMRGSNTKLIERVLQMERSLEESQNELHRQSNRAREAELKLAQKIQAQETERSQVESLSSELDAAEQTIQRQKILIEALTEDLNASQERIAQMERECALVQSRYNEQSYQLMQLETSCCDLRSRLLRQQRYTMQLKVALEKCTEPAASSSDLTPESNPSSLRAQSLFPNPQPITPWSIQTPNFTDRERQNHSESSFNSEWSSAEDCLGDRQSPYSFNSTPSTGSFELQNGNNSTTQGFFCSETSKELDLDDFFSFLQEEAPATDAIAPSNTTLLYLDSFAAQAQVAATHSAREPEKEPEKPAAEAEARSQPETSQPSQPDAPQPSQNQANLNWPSPVVYPWHPPKGRKSLASIELPKFPPRNQNQ
jgi:hypothetical protein